MADLGGVNWPALLSPGQVISNLPTDYYKSLEANTNQNLRDAFKNGLPTNPDGSPNFDAVAKTLLQLGGAPQVNNAVGLLNTGIAQQTAKTAPLDFQSGDSFVNQPPASGGPAPQTTNIPARQPQPQPAVQPQQPSAARPQGMVSGDNGSNTMMTYITSKVGPENAGYVAASIKGVDPNAPMPAGYEAAADRAIAAWQAKNGGQPQAQPVQVAQAPAPQNGFGTGSDNYRRLTQAASAFRAKAAQLSIANPKLAEQYGKQADAYEARAKVLLEGQVKNDEATPDMKNAKASGVGSPLEYNNQNKSGEAYATAGVKKYEALTNLGTSSVPGLQKMELMQAQLNDPSFYSGFGAGLVQKYKQLNAALGNPNAAASVEGFHKEANNVLNDNVKALGGSGVGQVRVAEIKIMQHGNANLGITPWTNRGIVEQNKRIYQDNIEVAKMAAQYRAQHGNIDSGFDQQVLKYYQDHPLFTPQELGDAKLIGAPTIKPGTPQQMQQQIQQFGLRPGDPFKTVDGRYKYVQ